MREGQDEGEGLPSLAVAGGLSLTRACPSEIKAARAPVKYVRQSVEGGREGDGGLGEQVSRR